MTEVGDGKWVGGWVSELVGGCWIVGVFQMGYIKEITEKGTTK